MTAAGYYPATNSLYSMMTGVDRAFRGRKIALALKLLIIKYAQNNGISYLRTNNDAENAPMLAVNRKAGYQPEPGQYRLLQKIS